ncbi:MAG: lipoprotein signal peptidase [Bacteroidales bacterium OttesenSCG-928-I14]|jgi:signal peptidase II|nr:lipoprotein signal peptidase [Bacteroidales bacterium OttesenSCG-928-I14]
MKLLKWFLAIMLIIFILVADQSIKIWVKIHLPLYGDIPITSWFHIYFLENNGMAMGIEIIGKLFLSIFRIIFSCIVIFYISRLIKNNFKFGYILCVSMIFAGAIGNIIDSIFYGVIFSNSTSTVISVFNPIKGYSTWLHGKVVDMFYFPLFSFFLPKWIPLIGGKNFMFFSYIFNVADASITTGIIVLLIFYRKTFSKSFLFKM